MKRRAGLGRDRTMNTSGYRITGTWPTRSGRPAVKPTQDKRARDRIARNMADAGAHVVVEEHLGHGVWGVLYELDGPAEAAARRQEQLDAELAAQAERREALARAEQEHLDDEEREQVERLMRQAPTSSRNRGRVACRHVAGGRGIR
ncbi:MULTISPECIES: hypothetical protein [unclassified Streptomyces]|uniref:hypothetical protein n=1 Tax=unclassified Streptomyces TaxID=2593676 RepID=UPI0037F20B52